jgi:Cd2+/Zn2+-exporting ATPase
VILGFLPFLPLPLRIVASGLGYLLFGFEVWRGMILGFAKRKIFTEFTLMCVATVCAFAIGEFADGAAVMYLYSLGETISGSAHARSRHRLSELLELCPESATVLRGGETLTLRPDEVEIGEILLIRSGDRIPLDGVVTEGGGLADSSSVTGESKPLELYEGIFCPSGSVLSEGSVCLRVVARASDSVAGRLEEAVRQATSR